MGLLSDMAAGSERRLAAARAVVSDAELAERCAALPRVQRLQLPAGGFDLIAELKLRSPALGDLSARTMDPVARLRGSRRPARRSVRS
jgi:indole-3-glycerol phosphate synthase